MRTESGRPTVLIRSATLLSGHRENSTIAVPTAPTAYSPAPTATPTAAVAHSEAAVVRPRMDVPDLRIAPAPRKPMPDTIWAAILVGSGGLPSPDGRTPTKPSIEGT